MFDHYDDDRFSRLATPGDAAKEYGRNAGMDNPDRAWILTPWDSWEKNPFYAGPPVPHPEEEHYGDEAVGNGPIDMARSPIDLDDEIPF